MDRSLDSSEPTMARADTACTGPYKDLSIANFSDVLWASASSSCSSLLLGTGVRDSDKVMVMSKDGHITDACSISPRDEASLSISTHNTTFTAAIVAAATTTAMPNTTDNCIPPLTQDHKRNFSYANLPPELIVHIFKFLVSAHDLRSAILVCKMWCNCGMDLLWSKPSLSTFATAERMVQAMAGPNTVFPYADYIRRLNLSFLAPDLTDLILGHFALCSRLERLLLAGSINITDAGLRRILSNCAGLCSLDLSEIPAITDALLESVAGGCPRLHTLYLGSCSSITDDSVVRIATSCPQLKRIKLSQCGLLTDRSILTLTGNCPQLIEIDMTSCNLVSSDAVHSIFENLPQIRDINMTLLAHISDQAFASIHPSTHRFEQLRILNLTSCSLITDETLIRIIPAAPRLRSLALTKCDKITDTGASVIKTLGKHLHYLHLGHCVKITDRLVATLAQHCTRIRYLDLACCTKLTDASLFALAQLPKLRRIGLVKCSNITDHGIYAMLLSQVLAQSLERVHLSYCIHLSESAVAALVTQCSKLTHLSVTGVHAFISPNYQRFCRAPPPEFTAHQREVFCVFSGKGVRDLRSYMQENPVMLPSEASLASLRASYGRATLAADAIALDGPDHEQESSLMLHSLTAATILAQMSSGMLATDAGMITQATGDQPLETLATAAAAEVAVATEGEEGVEADGPADMEGVLEESTQGPLVFLEDSGRSSSSFPGPSSPTRFPVLQHPHHRAPHYYHSHRTDPGAVVLDGSDMEVDQAFEEDAQGTDNPGRLPSPGTLARSLNRESEGSGAGSASPAEEEEEEADDEDEEL